MIAYFDASAVVPLLVEEPGTDIALRVFLQAETVATVRMTFAEVSAALARASRLGRLTADAHDRALAGLESVWAQVDVLDVDDGLVRAAGALARDHALRGHDAVHCAAALRVTSGTTVALAGDRDLLAAWQREGLQVLDTQS
ncbi:type II toxin-antitoxin system VapC family toxin [Geodermatophilus poikilotrophus]|uniref:Ribonuclease VapC n=1 Tax=Geodermatophilus poikilotrophus TaxID=1333667 RepID=A0A1I0CQI1_9ACTN|nr:type II toxin-antitoxin system VapC family toxin [Geodermatophilus poikilotrophus]SET21553.1 Predicted nucleic acid-binding protein, contains PIN domain [Geodermatophilus poikilotrophus]